VPAAERVRLSDGLCPRRELDTDCGVQERLSTTPSAAAIEARSPAVELRRIETMSASGNRQQCSIHADFKQLGGRSHAAHLPATADL
jgi:hypothetical protein